MHPALNPLCETLRDEVALHARLRDELAYEADREGKLGGGEVLRVQQRKYQLVEQIEEAEARRMEHVRELARAWDEAPEALTLSRIRQRCEPEMQSALAECHEHLLALVEEIRELARTTGAAASARLKAVDATLAVVGEAARVHPTYSEAGRLHKRRPTFKHTTA